jgi:hypothetical protein
MLNPHLTTILAHERERELRQARESTATPRELADHGDRARPRVAAALSLRWRPRGASAQLCPDSPVAE